jgi:hypothetical protein
MGKSNINRTKVEYEGHIFDSATEFQFYQYMEYTKKEFNIKEIIIQPQYILVPEYTVKCWKCEGTGKVYNPKTGKMNKCKRQICNEGIVTKAPITYDADFKIIYNDGREHVIDVKGYLGQNERFPLKKRMFEAIHGFELIVVTHTSNGWKWQT